MARVNVDILGISKLNWTGIVCYHTTVITYLKPDILECEVKWALGSITMNKASAGDRFSVELFQILTQMTIITTIVGRDPLEEME